jgi:hypothetical protein
VVTSAIVSSTGTRLDLSSGQPVSFLFINELVYCTSTRAMKGERPEGITWEAANSFN